MELEQLITNPKYNPPRLSFLERPKKEMKGEMEMAGVSKEK